MNIIIIRDLVYEEVTLQRLGQASRHSRFCGLIIYMHNTCYNVLILYTI